MNSSTNERRLRYALRKAGYALHKSRSRGWSLNDQLGYMIVEEGRNLCVGGVDYDYTLADVEWFVGTYC